MPSTELACSSNSSRFSVIAAAANAEPILKLKITWADIDNACAEICEYTPESFAAVISDGRRGTVEDESGDCWHWPAHICQKLRNCGRSRGIRDVGNESTSLAYSDVNMASGCTELHGFLWKLNADAYDAQLLGGPMSLSHWRRRLFFLQRSKGRIMLTYMSEKENGIMKLACPLGGSGTLGSISTVPTVEILSMTPNEIQAACGAMQQYDIAFSEGLPQHDAYKKVLPQTLHLFSVTWRDPMGENHRIILGGRASQAVKLWLDTIFKLEGRCKQSDYVHPVRTHQASSRGV